MAKWTSRYNVHHLPTGLGDITVSWDSTSGKGFTVSFGGKRLKEPVQDLEAAKKAGINLAKELLKTALADLDGPIAA